MRAILGLVGSLIVALASPSPCWAEGHGVGAGDGFPTGTVEQERVLEIPGRSEVLRILGLINQNFPTLAHRFGELLQRFEGGKDDYALVHVHASYPPAMADSQRSDAQTAGIPDRAKIVFFDELKGADPTLQSQVMLHELVHLLITRSNEIETVAFTEALLRLVAGETQQAASIATYLKESRHYPSPTQEEFSDILKTYEVLTGRLACSEVTWDHSFGFAAPVAPADFAERLSLDSFFLLYRARCLGRSLGGRMVLKGFTQNPSWHADFLRGLLDDGSHPPLTIRMGNSPSQDRFLYVDTLAREILRRHPRLKIRSEIVSRWIPSYAAWRITRDSWQSSEERARPFTYSVSDLIRFPIQWLGSGRLTEEGVRIEGDAGDGDACSLRTGIGPVEVSCRHRVRRWLGLRRQTVVRDRTIDLRWAMETFQRSTTRSYSTWPTLEVQ